MLQHEKISEGIDFDKSDKSKQCMICHYWYFKDIGYKYEPHLCNKCCDLLRVADHDLSYFMILNTKGVDYRYYVFNMSKSDAMNLLNNSWLDNKGAL